MYARIEVAAKLRAVLVSVIHATENAGRESPRRLVYGIDGCDRLCRLDADWDRFALANDGADVVRDKVLGTVLFDHIAEPTLQELTRKIVASVRADGRVVELPFRCDGPAVEREMRMWISSSDGACVTFTTIIEAERRRPPVRVRDLQHGRGPEALVRFCGWCNRGAVGRDWKPLEQAVAELGLFEREPVPPITHGLCGDCAVRLEAEAESPV